jgi:hypothetical protein
LKSNDGFKKILSESFGASITPLIVAGAAMHSNIAGVVATALFASQDTYKTKRVIKNLEIAVEDLYRKLSGKGIFMSDEDGKEARNKLYPLFWDYVLDEQEEDKIQLFVNGVVTALTSEEIAMEKMYVYFDILKSLRVKEIEHFIDVFINKNYKAVEGQFAPVEYTDDIDVGYHNYVRNKLEKLGLLSLEVINGNGTIDEDYRITELGNDIDKYFKSL